MISQFMMNSKVMLAISILALILMPAIHADRGHGFGRYGKKRSCCSEFEPTSGDEGMDALAKSFVGNYFAHSGNRSQTHEAIRFSEKVGFCGTAKEFGDLTCAPLCCRCCQSLNVAGRLPIDNPFSLSNPDLSLCYNTSTTPPMGGFLQSGIGPLGRLVEHPLDLDALATAYEMIDEANENVKDIQCDDRPHLDNCTNIIDALTIAFVSTETFMESTEDTMSPCHEVFQAIHALVSTESNNICEAGEDGVAQCLENKDPLTDAVTEVLEAISDCILLDRNPLNVYCASRCNCQN
eukprot:166990_1